VGTGLWKKCRKIQVRAAEGWKSHTTGKLSAVLVLLGISVFINYADRGNLSIAAPMWKVELGVSVSELGVLLSAFFWIYACLQPVSGWLVDRLNVNWVIAGKFLVWSAVNTSQIRVCQVTLRVP
jgi:sugar phosphate permease